jgi:2,3-bisphosphoglycerate-independent phosphoglycerate mutase
MKTLPVLLIILDGFGCRAERADNAIAQATAQLGSIVEA